MFKPRSMWDEAHSAGHPITPQAHSFGWHWLYDLSIAGSALHCAPGDVVIDIGAGNGPATEFLLRMGYRVIALDVDPRPLNQIESRLRHDKRLDAAIAWPVQGSAEALPLASNSVGGCICMNSLHHIEDHASVLRELHRVLEPGARAVFTEPGTDHGHAPTSVRVRRELGEREDSVDVLAFVRLAEEQLFTALVLDSVYPEQCALDKRAFEEALDGIPVHGMLRPENRAAWIRSTHPIVVLEAPNGPSWSSSKRPEGLLAELSLEALPTQISSGKTIRLCAKAHNRGSALWLAKGSSFGGQVMLGCKLCATNGRLLHEALARFALDHDCPPGDFARFEGEIVFGQDIPPGEYLLVFDLVSENVTWFEDRGNQPVVCRLTIE